MIVLGLAMLVIGWLASISILVTLGVIVLVIGLAMFALGAAGRPIAGRRHYW